MRSFFDWLRGAWLPLLAGAAIGISVTTMKSASKTGVLVLQLADSLEKRTGIMEKRIASQDETLDLQHGAITALLKRLQEVENNAQVDTVQGVVLANDARGIALSLRKVCKKTGMMEPPELTNVLDGWAQYKRGTVFDGALD